MSANTNQNGIVTVVKFILVRIGCNSLSKTMFRPFIVHKQRKIRKQQKIRKQKNATLVSIVMQQWKLFNTQFMFKLERKMNDFFVRMEKKKNRIWFI